MKNSFSLQFSIQSAMHYWIIFGVLTSIPTRQATGAPRRFLNSNYGNHDDETSIIFEPDLNSREMDKGTHQNSLHSKFEFKNNDENIVFGCKTNRDNIPQKAEEYNYRRILNNRVKVTTPKNIQEEAENEITFTDYSEEGQHGSDKSKREPESTTICIIKSLDKNSNGYEIDSDDDDFDYETNIDEFITWNAQKGNEDPSKKVAVLSPSQSSQQPLGIAFQSLQLGALKARPCPPGYNRIRDECKPQI